SHAVLKRCDPQGSPTDRTPAMFWRKKPNADPGEPLQAAQASQAAGDEHELDRALDALARIVRSYGQHAFDTDLVDAEALRQDCESWASKLLVGERQRQPDTESRPHFRRDYAAVQRFFDDHRS